MALPKGVKSGVDYRGLYSSNELEGDVLLEKEPELPKFLKNKTNNPSFQKPKVDPALNKGGSDFINYRSPNTFKTFTRRGGIAGFVNRRLGVGATKFRKPLVSAKAGLKLAGHLAKANPEATAFCSRSPVLPPIISKVKEIIKQSDAKIDKEREVCF